MHSPALARVAVDIFINSDCGLSRWTSCNQSCFGPLKTSFYHFVVPFNEPASYEPLLKPLHTFYRPHRTSITVGAVRPRIIQECTISPLTVKNFQLVGVTVARRGRDGGRRGTTFFPFPLSLPFSPYLMTFSAAIWGKLAGKRH